MCWRWKRLSRFMLNFGGLPWIWPPVNDDFLASSWQVKLPCATTDQQSTVRPSPLCSEDEERDDEMTLIKKKTSCLWVVEKRAQDAAWVCKRESSNAWGVLHSQLTSLWTFLLFLFVGRWWSTQITFAVMTTSISCANHIISNLVMLSNEKLWKVYHITFFLWMPKYLL